jgi:hypothetical protein
MGGQDGGQFSTSLERRFPVGREMSRDFLEISPDSALLGLLLEPVAKRNQYVAASLLSLRAGNLFARAGNSSIRAGIARLYGADQAALLGWVAADCRARGCGKIGHELASLEFKTSAAADVGLRMGTIASAMLHCADARSARLLGR